MPLAGTEGDDGKALIAPEEALMGLFDDGGWDGAVGAGQAVDVASPEVYWVPLFSCAAAVVGVHGYDGSDRSRSLCY